ncbi:hypothetical protein B7463_g7420, partial [Scytalidium lignicola]
MFEEIYFETLPKTFQEAIYVTRSFGIRCLWIDSLCIIQDSSEDWQRESVTMSDVYSGSLLNIAATSAEDSKQGLFRDRVPAAVGPCKVVIHEKEFGDSIYNCIDARVWMKGVEESPVALRAWIIQEQCNKIHACEALPSGIPSFDPDTRKAGCILNDHIKGIASPMVFWKKTVEAYSRAFLTKESDKLVAISGVGKFLLTLNKNDKYFAGLWRRDMEMQLLWRVRTRSKNQNCYRPKDYRAPSWSWVSIEGSIKFMSPPSDSSTRILATVIDVTIIPSGPDDFGQVRDGTLYIQCIPLKLASLYLVNSSWYIYYGKFGTSLNPAYFDIELSEDIRTSVYTMSIAEDEMLKYQEGILSGLLLTPTGRAKGQFRRLGYFLESKTSKTGCYGFSMAAPVLDRSLYYNIDSTKEGDQQRYFITII